MCKISKIFQIKQRSEITDFGSYRPGILYGSFTEEDVSLIFAYCTRWDYKAIVTDTSSKTIRVDNKITGRWGWIKKLWACIDPDIGVFVSRILGFFQGKKWRSRYCINENILKIKERIIAKRTQDRLDNTNWPYIITCLNWNLCLSRRRLPLSGVL